MRCWLCWMLLPATFGLMATFALPATAAEAPQQLFRAGAYAVDVTPATFPVVVNGMFEQRSADRAHDPLFARAIVLDDSIMRVAIVVVDSLMMPRELLDEAKRQASQATGIPPEQMLISATHTHSGPAAMGCLGSSADLKYAAWLPTQIARSIRLAHDHMQPARVGWGAVADAQHTFNRRWIRRPDRIGDDPFGQANVRANMHPGYQSADVIGPSGPVDDGLSLLALQTLDGRPLAVLANYSMHYYGSAPVSADYFGRFAEHFGRGIGAEKNEPALVAAMSQGTSGDLMWMDYGSPQKPENLEAYAAEVAQVAAGLYRQIRFHDWVPLAMREAELKLPRRSPDEARLAWAKQRTAAFAERLPRGLEEVYAREQILVAAEPERELKLQALCIGDLGITGIPNEVFALTGLKLKAQSPLELTFNIELANGAEGYIPPPEQHKLGGYTTWTARTAGLAPEAEPKIVEALLDLLEDASGKPRRKLVDQPSAYANAVLADKPAAFWRLSDAAGIQAADSGGASRHGTYEDGVAFYLPGPAGRGFAPAGAVNRAVHFAGGRLRAELDQLGDTYSVELWFWNGLPNNARPVTGYLFSRGTENNEHAPGDHLGIGGTALSIGCLIFFNGNQSNKLLAGRNPVAPRSWNHVALVREGARVKVYLNGRTEPEIVGEVPVTRAAADPIFLGGRSDNFANFAGKLDEIAIYSRALTAEEIAAHYAASGEQQPAVTQGVPRPTSAAESLALLHVRPGFQVELAVAEPLVKDPVAIEWGADGKLWVVEMADYPLGLDGKMRPGGRLRYLQDTDGDGRYDRSTLFLDGLNFPTGVLPWRKGVLVTAAPEIFYAEDTDGDGTADVRTTLFRGFIEGNPQLRVNGLQWGLDGWVYCANGWSGGVVHCEKTGASLNIAGRDLRIDPDAGLADALAGVSEFGRNRDDWGNWFGCDNSNPLFQFVLEDRYTRRNPLVAPPDARRQLMTPANPPVFARSEPQKRYHSYEQSGRFTSACAAMIYRDELLFGPSEVEHAFVCEPVHNLVHHEVLTAAGTRFDATRDPAEAQSEFLASTDPWFRPVMVRTGPDGALWVVDMYRFMIEHPEWLPPLGQQELSPYFRLGEDRGRIYRIYPEGHKPRFPAWPAKHSGAALAAGLDSPNGWQRDVVQQQLAWRKDLAAAPALSKLAAESPKPKVRLQALCALDTLGGLETSALLRSLADPHPAVRRQALRLAEARAGSDPQLLAQAKQLVSDPAPTVRLQLAATLGAWQDPSAGEALGELLAATTDGYIRASALSSIQPANLDRVLAALLAHGDQPGGNAALEQTLALAAGMHRDAALVDALLPATRPDQDGGYAPWQFIAVAKALDALEKRRLDWGKIAGVPPERVQQATANLAAVQRAARTLLADAGAAEEFRIAAAAVLLRDPAQRSADLDRLAGMLVPQTPPAVQAAVAERLGMQQDPAVAERLLAGWQSHAPGLRRQILQILLARGPWTAKLLDAVEARQVLPADIDALRRQQFASLPDAELRSRAERLLAVASDADRGRALQQLDAVLALGGDRSRGGKLFEQKCAACHRLGSIGHEVGPNLAALSDRSRRALLVAVLDPSRAIENRYLSYIAVTSDGRSQSGILEAETGNSITLLGEQGRRQTILRTDLEELRSTGKSLMPDGLEKDVSPQGLADLVEFVATAGSP